MTDNATLALRCGIDGTIIQLLHSPPGLDKAFQVGMSFARLAAPGNLAKALSFLVELRSQGAAFDWEINVEYAGQAKMLHFTGGKVDESLLIVAGENGKIALRFYEEMMQISNEQTNALRAALKSSATLKQPQRDDGPGIAAKEMEKLFKPFGRTSARATAGERSTGLGLVIVKRIVEGHGGKIWLESTQPPHPSVSPGTTFFVSLPIRLSEEVE